MAKNLTIIRLALSGFLLGAALFGIVGPLLGFPAGNALDVVGGSLGMAGVIIAKAALASALEDGA